MPPNNTTPDAFTPTLEEKKVRPFVPEIVWRSVLILAYLHIGMIVGLYYILFSAQWETIIFQTVYCFLAGLGVTAGAHRLWAHKSYKAKLPLRILLAAFNCMAVQTHIYAWCRDHRVHHKFSETDADPHDSSRGFFFAHMGWLLVRKHPNVTRKGKAVDLSDLLADPVVYYQKKFYIPLSIMFGFVIPSVIPYLLWNEGAWQSYYISVFRYVVLLHGTWLVNSAAHRYGSRPYNKSINPRENWIVSILAVGEGFHNYHHTFPWDYSTSELGWFFNLSTMFIDIMSWLGLAYDLKSVPRHLIEKSKEKWNNHCD